MEKTAAISSRPWQTTVSVRVAPDGGRERPRSEGRELRRAEAFPVDIDVPGLPGHDAAVVDRTVAAAIYSYLQKLSEKSYRPGLLLDGTI